MSHEKRQDEATIDWGGIALIGAAGVVVFFVSLAAAGVLLRVGEAGRERLAEPATSPSGTVERAVVADTERGLDQRRTQRESLSRYGWVDRDAGVVSIPIERAMELVASHPVPPDRPMEELR